MSNVTVIPKRSIPAKKSSSTSLTDHIMTLNSLVEATDRRMAAAKALNFHRWQLESLGKYYSQSHWYTEPAKRELKDAELARDEYLAAVAGDDLDSLREALNPKDDRDCKDGFPTIAYITKMVGLLLSSFPNGTPSDPEAYLSFMVAEIVASKCHKLAVETTMRSIRRECKFLPSIAEVTERLRSEQEVWGGRLDLSKHDAVLESLNIQIERVAQSIVEAEKHPAQPLRANNWNLNDEVTIHPVSTLGEGEQHSSDQPF